jgi:hypothetical protein
VVWSNYAPRLERRSLYHSGFIFASTAEGFG